MHFRSRGGQVQQLGTANDGQAARLSLTLPVRIDPQRADGYSLVR